jgi:protein-S-isoprenylcysteine O-methyltransferase Ste14
MLVLFRAITYATLFIAFFLVFLPARVLAWSAIDSPGTAGALQVLGMVMSAAGAALAVWCVVTVAVSGRGTPAPFDPPRRLVVAGPYRLTVNPCVRGSGRGFSWGCTVLPVLGSDGLLCCVPPRDVRFCGDL